MFRELSDHRNFLDIDNSVSYFYLVPMLKTLHSLVCSDQLRFLPENGCICSAMTSNCRVILQSESSVSHHSVSIVAGMAYTLAQIEILFDKFSLDSILQVCCFHVPPICHNRFQSIWIDKKIALTDFNQSINHQLDAMLKVSPC